MNKAPLYAVVLLLLWGCGETDSKPTSTPSLVSLASPVTTETEDTFEISYPCPWMLHTYITGHAFDQAAALDHLLAELNAMIPDRFRDGGEMHTREWANEVILSCWWEELKQAEIEEENKRHAENVKEAEQEFRRQVQEWRSSNSP